MDKRANFSNAGTAATVAREALRQLAVRRLPPTPENYTRAYHGIASPGSEPATLAAESMLQDFAAALPKREGDATSDRDALRQAIAQSDWAGTKTALLGMIGGSPAVADAAPWAGLFREFALHWDTVTPGLTRARKREALSHVLSAFNARADALYPRLRGLIRSWADAAANTPASELVPDCVPGTADVAPVSARQAAETVVVSLTGDADIPGLLRELLAQTLTFGVVERLGYDADLERQAKALAIEARSAHSAAALREFAARLKSLWIALEIRGEDQREVQQGLLRLLRLLAGNIAELIDEDAWLHGQLDAVDLLAAGPLSRQGIEELERALRDAAMKQGTIKKSLDDAKQALRNMLATFIDRLGTMADDAGGYHDRFAGYAARIERAEELPQLSALIAEVVQETRGIQVSMQRSRDEMHDARSIAEKHQARVRTLEKELASVSERLHEDMLTSLLNRRGLANAFDTEKARSERRKDPLCLAILDIDNFKNINDSLGHQAGDMALVHLAGVVRRTLRPVDVIARYGGEEFVILLPNTALDESVKVMQRVQRELTRQYFLHDDKRVLITFSAGVALRAGGETQDVLIERADQALYRAKKAGKNRVLAA